MRGDGLGLTVKRLSVVDINLCVGCQSCMFACARRFGEAGLGRSAVHIKSAGGIERGFIVMVCRACPDPPCAKVCPTDALALRPDGGVILNIGKCIGCKLCVDACMIQAIFWDDVMDKPVICVHCGICVGFCPYSVLELQRTEGGGVDQG
jgi:Fe-S-cluster-containing dehydrogenase component